MATHFERRVVLHSIRAEAWDQDAVFRQQLHRHLVQAPTRFGALAYILSRRTAYRIEKEKRTISLKSICLSLLLLFIAIRTDGQEQLVSRHVTGSEGNP
jgi:hypothetical protein